MVKGFHKGNVVIDKLVTIIGAWIDKTFISGDYKGIVFTIGKSNPDIDVKLTDMTIQGGSGIDGGGINNSARLIVEDSIIRENSAEFGAGIFNTRNTAKLTINRMDIVDNHATHDGAGIYNSAAMLIINSGTITRNEGEVGSGVFNDVGTVIMKAGVVTGEHCQAEV